MGLNIKEVVKKLGERVKVSDEKKKKIKERIKKIKEQVKESMKKSAEERKKLRKLEKYAKKLDRMLEKGQIDEYDWEEKLIKKAAELYGKEEGERSAEKIIRQRELQKTFSSIMGSGKREAPKF